MLLVCLPCLGIHPLIMSAIDVLPPLGFLLAAFCPYRNGLIIPAKSASASYRAQAKRAYVALACYMAQQRP